MEKYIRIAVYLGSFSLVLYSMSCLDYQKLLKGNKVSQAQIFYILMAIAIGYLVAEFFLNLAY